MTRDLHFEAVYPQPIERVWAALTDAECIAEWLMPNDFKPELGHRFQFRTKPQPGFDGIVDCEVIELDAPTRLAYTWRGGGLDTVVRWTLETVPEGTRLRLEHSGFQGPKALAISYILGSGWKGIVADGIRSAVERLP